MSSTDMIDDGFFHPGEPLNADEMRISFMGTSVIQRRTQVCSSVFVELGNGESFVFDCGAGCTVNYTAMQVPMSKMRRIFLTHLHGDHTSDLTHIYGFGPQQDGKSPLYIYGPSASLVPDPKTGTTYDDGTINFCYHLREMNRWHTEAQSFVGTQWCAADGDGYEIRATELNWYTGATRTWKSTTDPSPPNRDNNPCGSKLPIDQWIAYNQNGVKISFFPAVHDRNGSISYKLEWNGLSMIFTGDTQPNYFLRDRAIFGASPVDVLISEMVVPPDVWVTKNGGTDTEPTHPSMRTAEAVQKNSHTPERAFGFILQQLKMMGKAPRLAVATHFQAEKQSDDDDTITPASDAVRSLYPDGDVVIATDLMVINVSKDSIRHRPSKVSDYAWYPPPNDPRTWYNNTCDCPRKAAKTQQSCPNYQDKNGDGVCDQSNPLLPKYHDLTPFPTNPYYPMAPWAQFDQWLLDDVIPACMYGNEYTDQNGVVHPPSYDCQYPYKTKGLKVCPNS
ncbi:MBL fold metallo-hydrolase [Desulfobulbus sp. F4]|nr:MBL fold metallo-hydrolase [Desulfobulbus sp. F3]MCW5200356.1 MBL fold metallo-hydrolase [Desulfobulbus sp. F4]